MIEKILEHLPIIILMIIIAFICGGIVVGLYLLHPMTNFIIVLDIFILIVGALMIRSLIRLIKDINND